MKCYHEEKGIKVNDLHHAEPDLNCTCDVGTTGPAGDPALVSKGSGAYDHPQPAPASGPSIDPKLVAKGSGGCDHPHAPAAEGPAKKKGKQ